jgi:hypothetical protein
MTESEDIADVVRVLKGVPPKSLKIVELLNTIPIKRGELDPDAVIRLGTEIVEAQKEANAYKEATTRAVRAIEGI